MKALIIAAFLTLMVADAQAQSRFCAGFSDGYKAGACYREFACIAPIPPICPIPNFDEDSYEGGYQRGFIYGLNRRLNG